jgi:integrase
MLTKIPHYGYVLTDQIGLPRFWAAAWTLIIGDSLANSTVKDRLANIEPFYLHAESSQEPGILDDALGSLDLTLLEEKLEAYFISLRNVPEVGATAERRWRDAVAFVRDVCERLSRTSNVSARFEDLRIRLERLDRMYGQLRISKKTRTSIIRSLPASVIDELYGAVVPGSKTNPFKGEASQWRVYASFLLLFHLGLRRGEALSLVSSQVAQGLIAYLENYRGKQNHSYFLSSTRGQPLSA